MCITSSWSFKMFVPCSPVKVSHGFGRCLWNDLFFIKLPESRLLNVSQSWRKKKSQHLSVDSYSTTSKEQKLLSSSLLMHTHCWTQTYNMLYLSRWKFHLWNGKFSCWLNSEHGHLNSKLKYSEVDIFRCSIFSHVSADDPPAVAGFSDGTSEHGCFTVCLPNIRDPQCCSLWGESRLK